MEDNLPTDNLPTYQLIKDSPKLLPMLYKDCAQPAVQKVGKALETVFDFSNTILLPLKLINDKARLNFQKHMDNYKDKLESVDQEKIIEVPPIIGTPIIDRLSYITNDEIADLFINILTKASSSETINEAHPTFIHMVDRMSVDEARIISHLSNTNASFIPFINFICRRKDRNQDYRKIAWNLTGIETDIELLCPKNIDTYIDNLSSLRIIESQGEIFRSDESHYTRLEEKYLPIKSEINRWSSSTTDYNECEIQKGFFEITELGKSFIRICKK
jgi:hypothetical protein